MKILDHNLLYCLLIHTSTTQLWVLSVEVSKVELLVTAPISWVHSFPTPDPSQWDGFFVFLLTAIWQLHPKLASVSISLKNYIHIIYCNHMCCNLPHRWYCTKKSNLNPGRQCHIYFINRFPHEKNTSFSVCMVFDWNTYSKTQRCNQHEKVIIEKYSISSLFNIQSKYDCSIHIDLLMNYRELSLLV